MKNLIQNIAQQHKKTIISLICLIILLVATGMIYSFITNKEVEQTKTVSNTPISNDNSIVATFGKDTSTSTESLVSNNSWPGELLSEDISQVQPQRAGTITDWRVHIGEYVSAGEILGKISAPPATPELIKMLAEQTEAVTMARSQVTIADEYAVKEQARLSSLKNSLENNVSASSDLTFSALTRLREKIEIKKSALRAFIEQTINSHVTTISTASTWKSFSYNSSLRLQYGNLDQSGQTYYQNTLALLIDKLQTSQDVPIKEAEVYFATAVKFANNSSSNTDVDIFKEMASKDQNEFLMFLSEYRDAEAMLADKETEYKIMISEKGAMVEKDRSMAYASAKASEAAYNTVAGQITGALAITSPRAGTVSAIYKKVGDLVAPEMSIAVIAGKDTAKLTVRIRIPSNVNRPAPGDLVTVIRPGFTNDKRQAKVLGVGSSLDETGSYSADAILTDSVDWPVGSSVRVVPVKNLNTPSIKSSSIFWSEDGIPHIWAVSDAGRIFPKKITIGRTLGGSIEINSGIEIGEKYITDGSLDISENMFIDELIKKMELVESSENKSSTPKKSGHDHSEMLGM